MNTNNWSYVSSAPSRVRLFLKTRMDKHSRVVAHTPANTIWTAYFIHTSVIAFSLLLTGILPIRPPSGFINESLMLPTAIDQFIKWDAHWYTYIAQHGYDAQTVVFFPVLILGMILFSCFGLSYTTAGLLICNLFALFSYHMMYKTFRLDFPERIVRRALLAYAVMPTSFFLNSIYTESVFVVFSLSCVYHARQGKWMAAGIYGALSTLTRNLGIFLFIYLVYEYFSKQKSNTTAAAAIPLLFPPLALALYMCFNQYIAANPLAFLHSQQGWGRYFNSPINSYFSNIPLTFNGNSYIQPGASLDTFIVLLAIIGLSLLSFSYRFRIPTSYLIIGWLWLMIPLLSTSSWLPLYSASRFILVVFPIYLFLAQLNTTLYCSYLAISAVTLSVCAALFINWHWIG